VPIKAACAAWLRNKEATVFVDQTRTKRQADLSSLQLGALPTYRLRSREPGYALACGIANRPHPQERRLAKYQHYCLDRREGVKMGRKSLLLLSHQRHNALPVVVQDERVGI
jgi:hypothetical protein